MPLEPFTFERDARVYLVTPVAPFTPSDVDLQELAFADDVRKMAPNKNLVWMQGRYVEADRPNLNGAEWSARELSIASLSPLLMPITVMHDPSTAVGMIAGASLRTPENAGVDRARIDTTLALWAHRFPSVVEEAMDNYRAGTLMQSMECLPASYECAECGQMYPNLGGAERANWCPHLTGETATANGKPTRRLLNVTFTGTGLIYGSRGAKGAYSEAHLDLLQDEVAEFHERANRDHKPPRRTRRMDTIEITKAEYAELTAAKSRLAEVEPKLATAEAAAAKVPELERQVEAGEVAKKNAEDERDAVKGEKAKLEEEARAATLAGERTGKLGKGFLEKLPESIRTRLDEQAKVLKDEDWTARLEELAELTGVKPDEAAADGGDGGNGDTFSREEIARSGAGAGNGSTSKAPSEAARKSVVGGLAKIL